MSRVNNYILSLIWSLPIIVLFFLLITITREPATPHVFLLFKTFLLCFGFSSMMSYTYRRFYIVGISLFVSVVITIVLGLIPVVGPLAFWGLILFLAWTEFRDLYESFSKNEARLIGISALILAAVLLAYISLQEFSQLNNEAKLLGSELHIDTLYHVAIASMIKIHHVVSHGLHGLGPLEYHFGSHLFMAAASNLGFMSAFQAYNYFFAFLCIPLLGIMTISVAEEFLSSKTDSDFYKKLTAYAFIFLGTGVLLGGSLLSRFALWPSFFESESYALSLILLLALFSVCLARALSITVLALAICGIVGLMSLTKVSTGFCALSLVGAWALVSGEKWWSKSWWARWGIFFFCALSFLILFRLINPGMSDTKTDPMQFVRTYVEFHGPFWLTLTLFVLLHFIFPITSLLYYVLNYFSKKASMIIPAWWALGTFLSLAIGLGVILMFSFTGGAGYYFSNVSMFMALPILICIPQAGKFLFSKYSKVYVAIAIVIFLIYGPQLLVGGAKSFLADIKQKLPDTTLASYVEKLRIIRDDPSSINALVYIPRAEVGYWRSMDCRGTGYLIPAIAQRPALYAWPSNDCYTFLCGSRFHSNGLCEKSQESFTDSQLIDEAKKLGFSRVDIVTSEGIRSLQ